VQRHASGFCIRQVDRYRTGRWISVSAAGSSICGSFSDPRGAIQKAQDAPIWMPSPGGVSPPEAVCGYLGVRYYLSCAETGAVAANFKPAGRGRDRTRQNTSSCLRAPSRSTLGNCRGLCWSSRGSTPKGVEFVSRVMQERLEEAADAMIPPPSVT